MDKRVRIIIMGVMVFALIFCLTVPVPAAQYWVEGKVTAKPTAKDFRYLQVEGKTYTLAQDARIDLRYQDRPGAFNERPIDLYQIRRGQHVAVKVEGLRCYQVIVYE
ncbi:MAG: hypothetical protein ABII06_21395 [Pseudomonadota bacterium]